MILARPAAGVHLAGWGARRAPRYVDDDDPFIHGLILAGHLVPLEPPAKPKARPRRAKK